MNRNPVPLAILFPLWHCLGLGFVDTLAFAACDDVGGGGGG